jgi:signal transduction histidine kinase
LNIEYSEAPYEKKCDMSDNESLLVEVDEEVVVPSPSILLVDDRPANLLALEGVLEPLGYRMVSATSGEEALKRLLTEDFALILMDVQMPGLDGFQTVAMIKQRRKSLHVPIIFVSAIAKEVEHISKGYAYGAVDYITKPFDPEVLKAKVSVLMALHVQAERIARQRELLAEKRHELKQRLAEREDAERANRVKDEFLAFVSHELRTPLAAIVGWTELLVSGTLDPVRTRKAIETIRRNAEMQTLLVEDLITVSQIVLGSLRLNRQPEALGMLLPHAVESIRPLAEAKGVQLEYRSSAERDECLVDRKRLHQIVCNLLSNAVKFTPAGGQVSVSLTEESEGVRIEVSDTGVGISADSLPHVFDRFWQDQRLAGTESGLGLGLSIVRQLVELHGGSVKAASGGKDRGTTVSVLLPRHTASDARAAT